MPALRVRLALLVAIALAGCYETPKPPCSFFCGPALECPEDYSCDISDNRCKLRSGSGFATCPDLPTQPDAAVPDAPVDFDAGPDIDAAPPDASAPDATPPDASPSYSATISLQEVSVNGQPLLGQGVQVSISFSNNLTVKPPLFEEMPGSLFGCKVWEYTPAELPALAGLNEGAVVFTAMDGAPQIPPCTFQAGAGYLCTEGPPGTPGTDGDGAGAGGIIALVDAMTGQWSFTDTDVTTWDAAEEVGRYISISGSANGHSGAFPVVAAPAPNTVVFINPNPAALPETLDATDTWLILGGVGPIPGTADPGFLADGEVVNVSLVPGGDLHFEAFSRDFTAGVGGIGDDFTLDTSSQTLISDVPVDGSSFTIGCGGAGGTCNSALGSVLVITTTDGDVTGLGATTMPPPTTKRVSVRCANLGAMTLTVPATVSAFLMTSGATRIQAAFIRSNLIQGANMAAPMANYTIVAGHSVAGFTTP